MGNLYIYIYVFMECDCGAFKLKMKEAVILHCLALDIGEFFTFHSKLLITVGIGKI